MTKSRKSNAGAGPGAGHNTGERKEIIGAVCASIVGLEARRKVISEEIRAIKAEKIKGLLGMKITDFNNAFRLYQLEGAARDQFLATTQEIFLALGVGEQLNWVDALERTGKASTEEVSEDQEAAAAALPPA